jgi:hypothetical protein
LFKQGLEKQGIAVWQYSSVNPSVQSHTKAVLLLVLLQVESLMHWVPFVMHGNWFSHKGPLKVPSHSQLKLVISSEFVHVALFWHWLLWHGTGVSQLSPTKPSGQEHV